MPKSCLRTIHPYMQKARNLLYEYGEKGVGDWANRVARISRNQHLIPPQIPAAVFDAVYQAVLDERQLQVDYRRLGGDAEERLIHPQGLVFVDGVIYLVGVVWDYDDLRQFALHRIVKAEALQEPARKVKGFNLNAYIASGNFDFPVGQGKVRLKLFIDEWLAYYLEQCRLSEDQKITPFENGFILEATVLDTAQLQWWLLGLGDQVEVLEPSNVRDSIKQTIGDMYEQYFD